ncbi:MAG: HlyD family type I secretion periplasmic adaptor subunit [Desulfobulbaceae bacterium]|nr:HlyD family type I secretion periplasmic adaptor subunit [Desulfobulbaceae bacterium]
MPVYDPPDSSNAPDKRAWQEGDKRNCRSQQKGIVGIAMPASPPAGKTLGRLVERFRRDRTAQRDYEFLPATLEVLERPPAPLSRAMVLFIVVFAACAVGWASWAGMDIVVSAQGMVVPTGKVKIVQALEPGLVTAIHVRDGQVVKQGDPLITLDGTANREDLQTLEKELAKTELTVLRLNAQLQGDASLFQPPAGANLQTVALHRRLLDQSLAARRQRMDTLATEIRRCRAERQAIIAEVNRLSEALPLAQELYEKKQALAEKMLISGAELLQAQIEINDADHNLDNMQSRLAEVEARLDRAGEEQELARTEYRRDLLDQLTTAQNECEHLRHQIVKAQNRQDHFALRAPSDGLVQQLAIHTVGGVVTAAQPLLVIVPTASGFEVDAKILNKDIGFIEQRQPVSVKVAAFPFTSYGALPGTIEWVAGDAVLDQDLGPVYPVRIFLAGHELPNTVNGRTGRIAPGMTVTADVKVGQRRVIEYFLGPILRYRDQSLREM